jgi:hypothetical protein
MERDIAVPCPSMGGGAVKGVVKGLSTLSSFDAA